MFRRTLRCIDNNILKSLAFAIVTFPVLTFADTNLSVQVGTGEDDLRGTPYRGDIVYAVRSGSEGKSTTNCS